MGERVERGKDKKTHASPPHGDGIVEDEGPYETEDELFVLVNDVGTV